MKNGKISAQSPSPELWRLLGSGFGVARDDDGRTTYELRLFGHWRRIPNWLGRLLDSHPKALPRSDAAMAGGDKLAAALLEWRFAHDALGQLQEDWLDGKRDFTNTDESGEFMDRVGAADEALRTAMDRTGDAYAASFRAGAEAMREAAIDACDNLPISDETVLGAMDCANAIASLPLPEPPHD